MHLATVPVPAAACTDLESSLLVFASYILTQTKAFVGRGAAPGLMIIVCVRVLTLLPIKALTYLAEKLPPKKSHFPNMCSYCMRKNFKHLSLFLIHPFNSM
jgi:hypothetical protein